MGGGLMQLVAYGAQDIYLTGKPQITFFKSVYRRYTNFAIESIPQDIQGSPLFGSTINVTISRNGDLLKRLWLEYSPFDLLSSLNHSSDPTYTGETVAANLGHALIDHVDIEIGGQLIDRHYGKWLTIWNYLTESNPTGDQGAIDNYATGPGENSPSPLFGGTGDDAVVEVYPRATRYNRMAYTHRAQVGVKSNAGAAQLAWVPLQFWFCKNPGLSIPLIALQYHEVKFYITFAQRPFVFTQNKPQTVLTGFEFARFAVYADFVYLDTTERRQFAQNSHEYLIDQTQILQSVNTVNIKLAFNHPVKELVWAPVPGIVSGTTRTTVVPGGASPNSGLTASTPNQPNLYTLVLNGANRFSPRDISYFTRNQVWEAHTGFGSVLFPDCIGVYSFALRPEEHQPSGTCNFSRIDVAQLTRTPLIDANNKPYQDVIDLYAINYNVFRVMSGMGGLVYSN
jgi:hypothetical protein